VKRNRGYEKPKDTEQFLYRMHRGLTDLDVSLALRTSKKLSHPVVFVIGAPRAGTTLLAQAITYCYSAGYITNLAARFWGAPLVGIELSHAVLGYDAPRDMGRDFFRSHYGSTRGAGGLHEFGYFWKGWMDPRGDRQIERRCLWEMCGYVAMIQNRLGRPLVMKGALPALYAPSVTAVLGKENVRWVYIERGDTVGNCLSILDARRAYFGRDDAWFGYDRPGLRGDLEYSTKMLTPYEQIAGQVLELRQYYGRFATNTVLLAQLCTEPEAALRGILSTPMRDLPSGAIQSRGTNGPREKEEVIFQKAIERYCDK